MARGDTILAPFPFFIDDFERDTHHLKPALKWHYLKLLNYIWRHGSVADHDRAIAEAAGIPITRNWVANCLQMRCLMQQCPRSNGFLTQKRVNEERLSYLKNREKSRKRKASQREMSRGTPQAVTRDAPSPITSSYKSKKDSVSTDRVLPLGESESNDTGADAPNFEIDPKADLYRRGKIILGGNSGGQITRLLTKCHGNVEEARELLELAACKGDAREYIAGVLKERLGYQPGIG